MSQPSQPCGQDAWLLCCEALQVGHGALSLLPPLSLQLKRGQLWALVGANGSGKTTLMRTLLGLHPAHGGRVKLAPHTRLGYVGALQPFASDAPLRVVDLVRGGALRGWSALWASMAALRGDKLRALLQETNLEALAERPYAQLSEGQKQRVQLARALASEPDLLLLDEPTSAMDMATAQQTLLLLQRCARRRHMAVVVVGHQLAALLQVVDWVLWLTSDGQGAPQVRLGSRAELAADVLAEALGVASSPQAAAALPFCKGGTGG